MARISEKAQAILRYIAQGHSYEQIIDAYPNFTYLDIFASAQEALDIVDSTDKQPTIKSAYRLDDIRKEYPNAYEKWDSEQDNRLKELFSTGLNTNEIATSLKRKPGAITSRLKKLGLVQ